MAFPIHHLNFPPLLFPTCALIIGIGCTGLWLETTLSSLPLITIGIVLLGIAGYAMWNHNTYRYIALISLLSYCTGTFRLYHMYHATTHIPTSTPLDIEGIVTNIVIDRAKHLHQQTTVSVSMIATGNNQESHQVTTQLIFYSPITKAIEIGDTILLKNITIPANQNSSFKRYLLKEGIIGTVFLDNPQLTLVERPKWSFNKIILAEKIRIFAALTKKLSRTTSGLFATLFLGERSHNKKQISQLGSSFQYWGIMHYLARSGLHMVIFVATWEFLFRLLPIPFLIRHLILLLLAALYFLLSWPSIPFVRAFLTVLAYKICFFARRPVHTLATILAVCCAVLLYNPMQLFFLDFQLSFLLTFALAWFHFTTKNV